MTIIDVLTLIGVVAFSLLFLMAQVMVVWSLYWWLTGKYLFEIDDVWKLFK